MKPTREQAAHLRKLQAHPRYKTRNLRADIQALVTSKALHGYITVLESGIKKFRSKQQWVAPSNAPPRGFVDTITLQPGDYEVSGTVVL